MKKREQEIGRIIRVFWEAYSAQKLFPQEKLTPGKVLDSIFVFERQSKGKKKSFHMRKASVGDCGGQIPCSDPDVVGWRWGVGGRERVKRELQKSFNW